VRSSGWPFRQASRRMRLSATAEQMCSRWVFWRPRHRALLRLTHLTDGPWRGLRHDCGWDHGPRSSSAVCSSFAPVVANETVVASKGNARPPCRAARASPVPLPDLPQGRGGARTATSQPNSGPEPGSSSTSATAAASPPPPTSPPTPASHRRPVVQVLRSAANSRPGAGTSSSNGLSSSPRSRPLQSRPPGPTTTGRSRRAGTTPKPCSALPGAGPTSCS
jgi:hypothetical protein